MVAATAAVKPPEPNSLTRPPASAQSPRYAEQPCRVIEQAQVTTKQQSGRDATSLNARCRWEVEYGDGMHGRRRGSRSWRVECLDFMNGITAAFPNRKQFVLDNLNTHNKNEHWLKAHPNVQVHFTPTSAYWLQSGRGMVLDLAGGSRLAAPPSQASNSSSSTSMPTSKHITTKLSPSSGLKKIRQRRFQDERLKSLIESKYPGALGIGPLEAAIRGANAILRTIGHLRVADQRHRFIWSRRLSSSNAGACAQLGSQSVRAKN